jgi:thiamine transporter ThiT
MVWPVPAATTQRRLVFAIAIACYAIVFASFVLFEVPGLGIGHFLYIPVALLALAYGTYAGLLGGAVAAVLYVAAIVVTPRVPTGEVMTYATAIRFVTFTSCGVLVGWFANEHRRNLEKLHDLADRDFLTEFSIHGSSTRRWRDGVLPAGRLCSCSATWTTSRP